VGKWAGTLIKADISVEDSTMATPSTASLFDEVARRKKKTILRELLGIGGTLLRVLAGYVVLVLITATTSFPYRTDAVEQRGIPQPADYNAFYKRIYAPPPQNSAAAADPEDEAYVRMAREAIKDNRVVENVQDFVREYHMENARVLDVGAGTGYLQDVVQRYVGLDISPTASRYYHKPFIEASATQMPIPDGDFDLVWSVWVLEHVPNPEQALNEMRRVVKDEGMLFLVPAWDCGPYLAQGYPVRPFSDFDMSGKLTKAGMYLRTFLPFYRAVQTVQRATLGAREWIGPTKFHYAPLEANYNKYWMPDSDAMNGLDRYEMSLWFTSRGDECMNCDGRLFEQAGPLIIKVHKK
jgi:SAM-dependent methyltransferase